MTLHTRMLEVAKELDSKLGEPLARWMSGPRRALPRVTRDALLVRLWGLGNLAMLAPFMAAARRPGGPRLRLLTLAENRPFVEAHFPHVELLAVPEPHAPGFLPAVCRVARSVRRDPPDVIVDLEQFLKLPLVLLRLACPTPIVGLDTARQQRAPLLDRALGDDPTRHTADTFAELCHAAGLRSDIVQTDAPAGHSTRAPVGGLTVSRGALRAARRRAPPGKGPIVVVHPGSGDHAPGRRWPASRFGRAAAILAARFEARVVVTGSAAEQGLVDAVLAAAGPRRAVGCAGELGPAEWAALLSLADLLLTNDTGPVHVADALGTPTVALFGPNTPLRYGPRTAGSVALYADLPCSPCLDPSTLKRTACRTFACIDRLTVDDVIAACRRALPRTSCAAPLPCRTS